MINSVFKQGNAGQSVQQEEKDLLNEESSEQIQTIQFCDNGNKFLMKRGIIILARPQQINHKTHKAKIAPNSTFFEAKVHGIDEEEQKSRYNKLGDHMNIQDDIFSINENLNQLKTCREIIVDSSRINLYALRKIIKCVSLKLTQLSIQNCTFYQSDDSTLSQVSAITNNKMLRELNLDFMVKSLQLPLIENISIKLKLDDNKEKDLQLVKQKGKTINQDIWDQQKQKEDLINQYECDPNSEFINFELNIREKLEQKYRKYKNSNELNEYLITGNSQNVSKIRECIDMNIVKDIQEHVYMYNKYIKGSFKQTERNNVLIIKQDCLENPISNQMIENIIVGNQNIINTILFKDMGIIREGIFYKITETMLRIKNLESIAFIQSQPQQECYGLLKDVVLKNNFKYLVINRSKFNYQYYKEQVFGENYLEENKKFSITPVNRTSPSRFGYYILEKMNLFEFTPFKENQVEQILRKEGQKNSMYSYNIEYLLNQQKQYDISMLNEISKYQDEEVYSCQLSYESIYEDSSIPTNILFQKFIIDIGCTFHNHTENQIFMSNYFRYTKNERQSDSNKINNIFKQEFVEKQDLLKGVVRMVQEFETKKFDGVKITIDTKFIQIDEISYKQSSEDIKKQKIYSKKIQFNYENKSKYLEEQYTTLHYYSTEEFLGLFRLVIIELQKIQGLTFELQFQLDEYLSLHKNIVEQILTIIQDLNQLILEEDKKTQIKWLIIKANTSQIHFHEFKAHSRIVKKLKLENFFIISSDDQFLNQFEFQTIIMRNCTYYHTMNTHFKKLKKLKLQELRELVDIKLLFEDLLKVKNEYEQKILVEICSFSYESENELTINEQIISEIINQKEINFHLYFLHPVTQIKLLNQSQKIQIDEQINIDKLKQLFHSNDPQNNNESALQSNMIIPIQKQRDKSQEVIFQQKVKQSNQRLLDLHFQHNQRDFFLSIFNLNEDKKILLQDFLQLVDQTSECCKRQFFQSDSTFDNLDLYDQMQKHSGEFCFLKTSMYQDKNNPYKLNFSFFCNCFLNQHLIYFKLPINKIEILDFCSAQFCDISQFRFADFMIKSQRNLSSLKFKNVEIQEKLPIYQFQTLNNIKLIHLSISSNSLNHFEKLLESIQDITTLENFQFYPSQNCDGNYIDIISNIKTEIFHSINSIIDKNSQNLRKLKIITQNKEILDTIYKCKNLQKLSIYPSKEILKSTTFEFLPDSVIAFTLNLPQEINFSQEDYFKILQQESKLYNLANINIIDPQKCQENEQFFRKLNDEKNVTIIISKSIVMILDKENKLNENSEIQMINNEEIINIQSNVFCNNLIELVLLSQNFEKLLFLNRVFQQSQSSLKVLQISQSNLNNLSFIGVDFFQLPRTIKRLVFAHNFGLSSLNFLDPVLKKMHEFKIKHFDMSQTYVSLLEVSKFIPYVSNIFYGLGQTNIHTFLYPLLFHLYRDEEEKCSAFFILEGILSNYLGQSLEVEERKAIIKILLSQKIPMNENKKNTFSQLVLSPLQLGSSSCVQSLNMINKQIINKALQKTSFNSVYMIILALMVSKNIEQLLGFTSNYFKSLPTLQQDLSLSEYLFTLILINNNKNIKNIHLPLSVKINYQDYLFDLKNYQYEIIGDLEEKLQYLSQYIKIKNNMKLDSSLQIQNISQKMKCIQLENVEKISQDIKYLNNAKHVKTLNESTLINHLSKAPPSELIITGVSIQFIKTWYVINTKFPLICKTTIEVFDKNDEVFNTSIGNYLTKNLQRNNFLRNILYSQPSKYRYDITVQFLAEYFELLVLKKFHILPMLLFPLYLFTCIFGVIYFSIKQEVNCGNGISWYSYYCYLVFGFITLFVELFMFTKCLSYISHLIPSMQINLTPGIFVKIINFFKQSIIESKYINQWYMGYSQSFFQSQLTRFDNFTNVAFLFSTYRCEDYTIFGISLFFISIPFIHSVFEFLEIIFENNKLKLPTSSLDTFYKICNVIEFKAVADILDMVSPSNVTIIKGRMFSSRIISSFVRIVGESIPLVCIQIYNLSQREMTSSLILSLILSIITFLTLLINFLTITPSTLNQEDFNKLNNQKTQEMEIQKYQERLKSFEEETFALGFYSQLKDLRQKYLFEQKKKDPNDIIWDNLTQYKAYQQYFVQLFDNPMKDKGVKI